MGRFDGRALPPTSFLLGVFSLLAQAVLVRELFVVFYGSELNVGIVLASWLFWVGAGSLAGGMIPESRRVAAADSGLLPLLQVSAALALPATVLIIRSLQLWLPGSPGELLAFGTTALLAGGLLAAMGLLLGLWFTLAASCPSEGGTGPGRAYAWEAAGGLFGGAVFSYLLADRMEGLSLAAVLALVAVTLTLAGLPRDRRPVRRLIPAAALLLLGGALLGPLQPPFLRDWVRATQSWRWPGMEMVDSRDSRYGNLALLRLDGQLSLFENGTPGFSFPDPLSSVHGVHIPLLASPDHDRILLLGGGMGGGIGELLRYPVKSVDYLEFDPEVIRVVEDHLPDLLGDSLGEGRVRILHQDGRSWLRRRRRLYDVIIVNLPEPSTAMINRFYTREFFELARENLSERGVLALALPAAPNYYGKALRLRNGSIYQALRSVFPAVSLVPAGRTLMLASPAPRGIDLEADSIARRLDSLGIAEDYLRPGVIESFLDPLARDFIHRELTAVEAAPNSDFSPAAYFYHTVFWSGMRDPGLAPLLEKLLGPARFWPFLLAAAALLPGLWNRRLPSTAGERFPLGLAAFTTGWGAMSFQYLVLFVFQTDRGHLYRQFGLLNGAFMAGIAAGGFSSLRLSRRGSPARSLFLFSEAALVIWPFVLGVILQLLAGPGGGLSGPFRDGVYVLAAASSGFFLGFQFPLLPRLHGPDGSDPGAAGGRYYFLDLAGSACGVLLTSIWLLPILGVWQTLLLCVALKAASWVNALGVRGALPAAVS
jgi:spermidine synthase